MTPPTNINSRIAVTKVGVHTLLTPQESITHQNCAEFEASLHEALERNQTAIILDCKGVGHVDSMALELLLKFQETAKMRGCQLKFVGFNAVCRDILIATRLINQFLVYADVQEAIKETV